MCLHPTQQRSLDEIVIATTRSGGAEETDVGFRVLGPAKVSRLPWIARATARHALATNKNMAMAHGQSHRQQKNSVVWMDLTCWIRLFTA
jgi:hypothetical protein